MPPLNGGDRILHAARRCTDSDIAASYLRICPTNMISNIHRRSPSSYRFGLSRTQMVYGIILTETRHLVHSLVPEQRLWSMEVRR